MSYTNKAIQILQSAKELFSERGYNGVSTKEIAEKASANEVTLFRHFKTKDNLFQEVVAHFYAQPTILFLQENKKESLIDSLQQVAELMHKLFIENISMIKIEMANIHKVKNSDRFKRFPNILRDHITNLFLQHTSLDRKDAEIASICFFTQIRGICMSIYIHQNLHKTPCFHSCLQFILHPYSIKYLR